MEWQRDCNFSSWLDRDWREQLKFNVYPTCKTPYYKWLVLKFKISAYPKWNFDPESICNVRNNFPTPHFPNAFFDKKSIFQFRQGTNDAHVQHFLAYSMNLASSVRSSFMLQVSYDVYRHNYWLFFSATIFFIKTQLINKSAITVFIRTRTKFTKSGILTKIKEPYCKMLSNLQVMQKLMHSLCKKCLEQLCHYLMAFLENLAIFMTISELLTENQPSVGHDW